MIPGLLVLAVHVLSGLVLAAVLYQKTKSRAQTLAAWLVLLAFPLGGLVLVVILFSPLFFPRRQGKPVLPLPEMVTKGDGPGFVFVKPLNVEEEINVTPLEETLVLADKTERRKTVLNILKKEITWYTGFINQALANDDSETTHYAAAGVLHYKRKLDARLYAAKMLYDQNLRDPGAALGYASVLEQCLKTVDLDPALRHSYLAHNIEVLENIINNQLDPDQAHIIRLIGLLAEKEDVPKLHHYNQLLWHHYPDTEQKYMTLLNSYYTLKDKTSFHQVLQRFKDSDLVFSHDALQVVRFWMKGGCYEFN